MRRYIRWERLENATESSDVFNNLNFWNANTNFDIDAKVKHTILQTPGVEVFTILSPYRACIAIGLAFDEDKVKRKIGRRLGCYKKGMVIPTDVKRLELDLQDEGNLWCIYVLPNGKYEYFSTKDKKEHSSMVNSYKNAKEKIGGKVIVSGV